MGSYTFEMYEYTDKLNRTLEAKLPNSLQLKSTSSSEAILLRLLMGKVYYKKINGSTKKIQNVDYTCLPFTNISTLTCEAFKQVFGVDITEAETADICNKYFRINRKNSEVNNFLLSEITLYFYEVKTSPISAFVHLYRCLEYMSYSFPMIYASKTRNYIGSYESLKKFLSGDSTGELGFLRRFIDELFKDEPTILAYEFEINISSMQVEVMREECKRVFGNVFVYDFETTVFKINFKNMLSLFITLRNRYFHMLVGKGQVNFKALNYDINELFEIFNPHLLNWFSIVFSRIIQHGFESSIL